MPFKPKKPCRYPGCPSLTDGRYCKQHSREYEKQRGYANERGYDIKWQTTRKRYLKNHPLCVECHKEGKLIEATVVDHIIPHRGNKRLMWDESNWQALCKKCHDKKTGTKDQTPVYTY